MQCHYAECHYAECHYAERHYAECHYAECHYAECHYAECRGAKSISVFVVNDIGQSQLAYAGSTKANGREPKSCLVEIFNFKLGCFCYECNCMAYTSTLTSRVGNLDQNPMLKNLLRP
jgi:hypothetical protein